MKYLRQYIRRVLLTEAAVGPDDLAQENAVVVIEADAGGVRIFYGIEGNPDTNIQLKTAASPPDGHSIWDPYLGEIFLTDNAELGKLGSCGGAWMVGSSEAKSGWGPLIYDVAMEYATIHGGGLMSDRGSVSDDARGVWNYYMANRGDVTGIQMDDSKNTLTPEEEDNCDQEVAGGLVARYLSHNETRAEEPENPDWMKSSLSKRWTKPPTQIEKLRSLGRLVEK